MLAGLPRYIATVETAKHRIFEFLDAAILPDNMLICIAHATTPTSSACSRQPSPCRLGAGCRRPAWRRQRSALQQDPLLRDLPLPRRQPRTANPHRAPSPSNSTPTASASRPLHPDLTLTGMYNVLEKLRSGEPLTAKDKTIHEQGLVAVLRQLHDELDAAVLAAYGWSDLAPTATDALLDRLVALNAERSREEATGHIRWLRPDFQNPASPIPRSTAKNEAKMEFPDSRRQADTTPAKPAEKRPWPPSLPEQVRAIADASHPHAARRTRPRRPLHRQRPVEKTPPRNPRHARRPRPRQAVGRRLGGLSVLHARAKVRRCNSRDIVMSARHFWMVTDRSSMCIERVDDFAAERIRPIDGFVSGSRDSEADRRYLRVILWTTVRPCTAPDADRSCTP